MRPTIVGGAANPGGIINRITKTPQRYNFTTVESNVGSYGFARGMIDANGVMPNREDIRGRLVFAVEDGGTFIDHTPVRQYTVAPSVEFDLFAICRSISCSAIPICRKAEHRFSTMCSIRGMGYRRRPIRS